MVIKMVNSLLDGATLVKITQAMYINKPCAVIGMNLQSDTVGADDPLFTLLEF